MGPEATADLYLRIIRIFQKEYGAVLDSDFPEIIILNLPIPDIVDNLVEETTIKTMLIEGVKKLQKAGSDFIAIPCNTVMDYLPEMQKAVKIPILNIIQETIDEIKSKNLKKIGLLATETTIRKKLYQKVLNPVKIEVLNQKNQKKTTKIIMNILSGDKNKIDKTLLNTYIDELINKGAEKVILGCTELPLLINNNKKTIDTLDILARAVVNMYFSR